MTVENLDAIMKKEKDNEELRLILQQIEEKEAIEKAINISKLEYEEQEKNNNQNYYNSNNYYPNYYNYNELSPTNNSHRKYSSNSHIHQTTKYQPKAKKQKYRPKQN